MVVDSDMNVPLTFSYRALELYRNLTMGIAPFYRQEANINAYNQMVLVELFAQLYSTGESILILTSHGNIWESDILLRTLFEGTIKYIYMMQDILDKKSDVVEEYYNIIPEMQRISDHEKAVEALNILKSIGVDKHPFQVSVLKEEELEKLKEKYSRTRIKELSRKWSYKNILKDLIKKNSRYELLSTTLYTYSSSSHLIHYDGECLKQRSGALMNNVVMNDATLDLAHLLRIVSNVISLSIMRVREYAEVYNLGIGQYRKNLNDNFLFIEEIEEIINKTIDGKY